MRDFKINDQVRIINPDYVYSTYKPKFKELNFLNSSHNPTPENYDNYVWCIFNITTHNYKPNLKLYAVYAYTDKGRIELLIDNRGIELIDINSCNDAAEEDYIVIPKEIWFDSIENMSPEQLELFKKNVDLVTRETTKTFLKSFYEHNVCD